MGRKNVFEMKLEKIYSLLTAKALKKGRTQEEVDRVIFWQMPPHLIPGRN